MTFDLSPSGNGSVSPSSCWWNANQQTARTDKLKTVAKAGADLHNARTLFAGIFRQKSNRLGFPPEDAPDVLTCPELLGSLRQALIQPELLKKTRHRYRAASSVSVAPPVASAHDRTTYGFGPEA